MHEATAVDQGQGACKGSDDHATENKTGEMGHGTVDCSFEMTVKITHIEVHGAIVS